MTIFTMPEWNFRNVRLVVYTIFTWIGLVGAAAAQNTLHKAESSVGAKRTRLEHQAAITYPAGSTIVVHLQVDDLHGIAAAVMFAAGMLGIVYVVLQNAIILEKHRRWKPLAWLVRFVESSTGHLILAGFAVLFWLGTIVCTALSFWIAYNRAQNVQIVVNGINLSQATIDALERANDMPTRYWGHGYVRFMCIAPWLEVFVTPIPFALHIMAHRRLLAQERSITVQSTEDMERAGSSSEVIESTEDKGSFEEERIEMRADPVEKVHLH